MLYSGHEFEFRNQQAEEVGEHFLFATNKKCSDITHDDRLNKPIGNSQTAAI